MSETETRSAMWCDVCRQGDTDPRHHILQADGTVQTRHMDCCRDSGCHDQSCDSILSDSEEKRGIELLGWIKENK
jgi:hypothetical protein